MRYRSIPLLVVAQLLIGLLQNITPATGETRATVRSARELLAADRLAESLAAYEAIVEAGGGREKVSAEALYRSSLILLAGDESIRDPELARRRLAEPETVRDDLERELAAKAILSLFASLDAASSDLAEARLELATERRASLELTALKDSEVAKWASRFAELEAEHRDLATLHAVSSRDLVGCEVERELLTDQLMAAQADQEQMLESVFRKNAELVTQAAELSDMRAELETRSEELAAKEAELEDREEAIRRVTEAILEEDETGDGG